MKKNYIKTWKNLSRNICMLVKYIRLINLIHTYIYIYFFIDMYTCHFQSQNDENISMFLPVVDKTHTCYAWSENYTGYAFGCFVFFWLLKTTNFDIFWDVRYTKVRYLDKCRNFLLFEYNSGTLHLVDSSENVTSRCNEVYLLIYFSNFLTVSVFDIL